jgi:hypothetical protein
MQALLQWSEDPPSARCNRKTSFNHDEQNETDSSALQRAAEKHRPELKKTAKFVYMPQLASHRYKRENNTDTANRVHYSVKRDSDGG